MHILRYIHKDMYPHHGLTGCFLRQVACGLGHALLLGADGTVYSMGSNAYGQLGTGDIESVRIYCNTEGSLIESVRIYHKTEWSLEFLN